MPAGNSLWRYLLILAVLGNCLPSFAPEDANRDRRVDLSDAVAQVRSLVEAAQNHEAGRIDIRKTILAVNATAGLGHQIAAQRAVDRQAATPILDFPFFISCFTLAHHPGPGVPCLSGDSLFSSNTIAPAVPPPRNFLHA